MALTFFEPKENPGNGEKPFLNEWLENNPKNKKKEFLITEIIRVKSGKGYLLVTDDFTCFLWKNQALTKLFIEALDFWVNNSNVGYCCYVVLRNPSKQDFTVAADKEQETTWFNLKNGYTTSEENANLTEERIDTGGNPFL